MTELTWYAIDRELIGDVTIGDGSALGIGARSPNMVLRKERPIAVGYDTRRRVSDAPQPPSMFVIDDHQAAEVMSWVRVYDRSVFPLSQFGRVISADDIFLLEGGVDLGASRSDVWACVVLGEVLARGEYADAKLSAIPLSHAASTFSHVVARAALVHGKDRPVDLCIKRLATLESDSSLGRKPMATRDLQLIWGFLQVELGVLESESELLHFIDETLGALARGARRPAAWVAHRQALTSDSVEARMVAFSSILNDVVGREAAREVSGMEAGLYVAAAAFLAGRGTGHYFLLRRTGPIAAAASVWFGLLAGLRGRHAWDVEWLRAVKGIERQLRQTMSWADPPTSDLGWLEYSWLAKNVAATAALSGIARLSARALAIEVLPGAVCQMRTSHAEPKLETQTPAISVTENELRAALEQFLALSERTKKVLTRAMVSPSDVGLDKETDNPSQKSFFSQPKSRRSKKT